MEQILFGFFHHNLDNGLVSYPIWIVVPIPVLILSFIGLILLFREKRYALLTPIAVGLAYWVVYVFDSNVYIIEYPRIAAIVATLLIIPAGVGVDYVIKKLPLGQYRSWLTYVVAACAALAALFLASIYPAAQSWKYFPLHQHGRTLLPSPPVNRYLQPDDLRLFAGIHGARFVAPSWKALAIGTATGNYPLETKPATIWVNILSYSFFMAADCPARSALAEKYSIDYVYSMPFDCPGFKEVGKSAEGLHLYKLF